MSWYFAAVDHAGFEPCGPAAASGHDGSLAEWRQLRSEQDAAYLQSLHVDQLKDQQRAEREELDKVGSRQTYTSDLNYERQKSNLSQIFSSCGGKFAKR